MNNEISPGPSSTYADAYKLSFLISLNWIVLFLQFANSHFISSLPSFSWHFFSLHFLFTFLERLIPPSFIPGLTILPASMFDYCLDLLPMWDFTFVCKINEKKKPKGHTYLRKLQMPIRVRALEFQRKCFENKL